MLSVVMLNVVLLSVVAPPNKLECLPISVTPILVQYLGGKAGCQPREKVM
jgi:hypothetical protein